jgi:DNA-directed RNA polymerase subunit M/transcription elongation factor TFIIS
MVAAEIATGYSALKVAYDIAKGLKDINDRVALNAAVIELQEKILSAQESAAAAREKMRDLEETVLSLQDWRQTSDRYRLVNYGGSTFAYEIVPEQANGEPIHRACPTCFESKRRSVLQFQFKDNTHRDFYKCPSCAGEFRFGEYQSRSYSRQTRY